MGQLIECHGGHFVSVDQVRNRMNCAEPNVRDDSLGERLVRKARVGAAPVLWLHDLPEDEIADIYAILERPKPG